MSTCRDEFFESNCLVFKYKEGNKIELLELYYKKYTNTVQASDYVDWAIAYLYMDVLEINKLASMGMNRELNLFEIEEMFAAAMKALLREPPTKKQCLDYHLKQLHSQLLQPNKHAISIVKEIYKCIIENELFVEQQKWQEISDIIDDFQYGDNIHGYTSDNLNEMIMAHARKLWHLKMSEISFERIIGQRVIAIDTKTDFLIELEKGAIKIECPWRIRDADGIVLGETDLQSNEREWKTIKDLLVGKKIEDVQALEQCPLLIVQFGNLFLDVFHASSNFDGWFITDKEDFFLFSMHGGELV
ncbi:hypothetical protein [Metabacillus niabensis]|uniref:hypothetical protein n=1 Tax=Metabacillus TaxID=2675233 RepID=UPI002106C912